MYTEHPDGAVLVIGNGEAGTIIIHTDGVEYYELGDLDRIIWRVAIIDEYGRELYSEDNGVQSPAEETDPRKTMHAFVSFLLACADSKSEESENYSLFPSPVREWAELWSDELQLAWTEELDDAV